MSATATLLSGSSVKVTRQELAIIPAPASTKTWFPVPHGEVARTVENQLSDSGFTVREASYAVSRDRLRMFGTLDLESAVAPGVTLAVGVRNSNDQSFPIAFAAGNRVMVCDNLSFHGESVVSRKHTRFGVGRFTEALSRAVYALHAFQETESRRIGLMQSHELSSVQADSFILQAYERGILGARYLDAVIQEYRKPRHAEFSAPTVWSLLNAFTEALKPRLAQPGAYAKQTIQLQGLLCQDARYQLAV